MRQDQHHSTPPSRLFPHPRTARTGHVPRVHHDIENDRPRTLYDAYDRWSRGHLTRTELKRALRDS